MKEFLKNKKGIIGFIDYDKKIYFSRRDKTHQFRIFGMGFGLSINVLEKLEKEKIKTIVIEFCGIKKYCANTDTFLVYGHDWKDEKDQQIILPLKYFNQKHLEEKQLIL